MEVENIKAKTSVNLSKNQNAFGTGSQQIITLLPNTVSPKFFLSVPLVAPCDDQKTKRTAQELNYRPHWLF